MDSGADSHLQQETNLALLPGVQVCVSLAHPTGGGARYPDVLLNKTAHQLDGQSLVHFGHSRTYNTYDGQNQADGSDWYAIEFPQTTTCNCIEMTMSIPYRDGGWWTALNVETRDAAGGWHPVTNFTIMPSYDWTNARHVALIRFHGHTNMRYDEYREVKHENAETLQ